MNLHELFGGDPSDWIPSKGLPARCLVFHGMASLETADQRIEIFTSVQMVASVTTGWMIVPSDYGSMSLGTPDGLLRDRWRPRLYYFTHERAWIHMGSQRELLWRWDVAGHHDWPKANKRAQEILLDNLREHQTLEYILDNKFTVIGGLTGNTYQVEGGNGFALIRPDTREVLVSYCLHPEYWMPEDDVALAIKLALERPETEAATLIRAKAYIGRGVVHEHGTLRLRQPSRAKRIERYAADMERELL